MLKPKLLRLEQLEREAAECPTKASTRPTMPSMTKAGALARIAALQARVAVAEARATAALRAST